MGKVERLPKSKPLGPRAGNETVLNQGGPKQNKRAVGMAESAMKASRVDLIPASVRMDAIVERQTNQHTAEQISDLLQGVKPEADTVSLIENVMVEGQTYVVGKAESKLSDAFRIEPSFDPYLENESARTAGMLGVLVGEGKVALDTSLPEFLSLEDLRESQEAQAQLDDDQDFFDYGTTAKDLREI